MSLYLYQNNQQTGPFSEDQISQMLRAGIVTPDTLGWKQGMAGWERISELVTSANTGFPPTPPAGRSWLGIISLAISLVALIGWIVLLVAAGMAHNAGTATQSFNVIVGVFFLGGVCLNFVALVLGVIGAFKSRANTLAIVGACLNGFELVALIGLMILGLVAQHAR